MNPIISLIRSDKIIVLTIFIFSVLINYYSAYRGIFPMDSFSHYDIGFRILLGDHPFKDYWAVSGPFIDYFQGLLFYILGANWISYVLQASILNGIVSVTTFFLFKKLGLQTLYSFIYSICFAILAYPSSGTPFVDHHSTLLSILAIYTFIFALQRENYLIWFLIPIIFAFAFLSKQVPAFYFLLIFVSVIIYHFLLNLNKKTIKILLSLFVSSALTLIIFILFLNIFSIEFSDFINQYILYPKSIGANRYLNLEYDLQNTILNFKFIYLVFLIYSYIIFKSFFKDKKFYTDLKFKIYLISLFTFIALVHHTLLTKNQIIIFFLIPLFSGLAHIYVNKELKLKKYLSLFLIFLCIGATLKYHLRFNVERKFHELQSVDISENLDAGSINKKFTNLKWVTPEAQNKQKLVEEIKYLKKMENLLKTDVSNKIIYTHYSFFSVILEENVNSPSRWFPQDGSAFPISGDKFFNDYQKLLIAIILKKDIKNVYVLKDVSENMFTDYINTNCINKISDNNNYKKFKINRNCKELN